MHTHTHTQPVYQHCGGVLEEKVVLGQCSLAKQAEYFFLAETRNNVFGVNTKPSTERPGGRMIVVLGAYLAAAGSGQLVISYEIMASTLQQEVFTEEN